MDVEDLPLDDCLLALALLAPIALTDDLALTLAIRAYSLEALNHGAHLAHHHLHTTAVTARALLHSTFLPANAAALGADD